MNEFIDWSELDFRKRSGREKLRCPKCDDVRSDKKDKSLVVYHNDGVGKCFYCEALTFRDEVKPDYKKSYVLPNQDWRNHTTLSDKLVKHLENERKIRQSTLIDLGITEEKHYQPALKKEVNNIVFNYFERDVLVNKKYRSGNKKFTQSTSAKTIFYNINSVVGSKEVYIVEGEFDVLAMHQSGFKACISVPNGANDNDEYWTNSEPYLRHVERFIIATDNDEKGNALKDKISHRLGKYRCSYIEWQHKDANGDLIAGVLEESVKNQKTFPVSGTYTVDSLKDGIFDLYNNGLPETIYPKHECFGNLKHIYAGMRGHVSVGTGIPSHGKSNWTEWYVLNLIYDYDMKASFFSPEHSPMELHQTNFIQKAVGKNFWKSQGLQERITHADIERYSKWANEKLYLTNPEKGESPTWDWILDKFKEQLFNYGINIFVIDAFNKLILPKGVNKLDAINDVMTKLTMFAQMNDVMIFLIVHPTKMKLNEDKIYEKPSLYDCSGSADFRNQTHDGFTIYRYFKNEFNEGKTTFINLKTKYIFQGHIGGEVDFNYDVLTGRYYAQGEAVPRFDMTKPKTKDVQLEMETPRDYSEPMLRNEDFYNDFKIEDAEEGMPF